MKTPFFVLPFVLAAATASMAQQPPAAPDTVLHIVTYLDLLPDQADSGRALLAQQTQAERNRQGCRSSELLQEQGRGNHFMLVEVWNEAAALDGWHASGDYRRFRTSLQPALASPLDERRAYQIAP